jgi:hypothetical protein
MTLSIAAALALGVAVNVAGAATDATSSSESSKRATTTSSSESSRPASTNDLDAAEEDNPHDVDYAKRPEHGSSTNDEIDAAEQGSPDSYGPDSYDNKDAPAPSAKHANKLWRKAESEDPDAESGEPAKR